MIENFNEGNLPLTRRGQILDVLRYHLFEIITCSIYTFLFALPSIVWIVFVGFSSLFSENQLLNVILIYGVLIFLLMIMSLGFAGGLYFFKRLLFNEGANVTKDFALGIKKNGKSFAKIFALCGIFYFILHTSLSLISVMELNSNFKIILSGLSYALFFLVLIVILYMQTQTILYQVTFKQLLNNAMRFTFGYLHKNILIFILVMIPFLLFEFIPYNFAIWISIFISMVFYFGFAQVVFMAFSLHVFDMTINKNQFKEIYRKGLKKNETDHFNL